jgi:UDP-4-amino-4,6-dideoxy-N-acetyl-beta-L-altrosamine transaminase
MMIPYGRQDISQTDIDAVVEILRSDFLTQGPAVPAFEKAVAARVGAAHAVAANSATSALHIACLALGLKSGDWLWTVPNTFVASANCGRYCDAEVDFIDIDPRTLNLSVPDLRRKLAQAKKNGRLPKIVVPVHFAGQPTEQEAIWDLAQEYGFRILEDASHAIGASRSGEPVGSCRWSDITVFSFHPVKIITTGEGGMALTNDEKLAEHMAMFRSHGITRDPARFQGNNRESDNCIAPAPWYYEQQLLGFNYRMTDIQAALGLSQLDRIDQFIERRRAIAARYDHLLADLPITLPWQQPDTSSAFHLYVIRLELDSINGSHREIFEGLRGKGIAVNLHYVPVHTQPYYRELGFKCGDFPEAERYYSEAISLPMYYGLRDSEQDYIVAALRDLLA